MKANYFLKVLILVIFYLFVFFTPGKLLAEENTVDKDSIAVEIYETLIENGSLFYNFRFHNYLDSAVYINKICLDKAIKESEE